MFQPSDGLSDGQQKIGLEVYRQKYENYRHLDRLRWQTPAILFAATAVIGATTEKGDAPHWWVLLLFTTFSGCCWYLMRRIRFTIGKNTLALQVVGEFLGDRQIPPPAGRIGAAYVFECAILGVTILAFIAVLIRTWNFWLPQLSVPL